MLSLNFIKTSESVRRVSLAEIMSLAIIVFFFMGQTIEAFHKYAFIPMAICGIVLWIIELRPMFKEKQKFYILIPIILIGIFAALNWLTVHAIPVEDIIRMFFGFIPIAFFLVKDKHMNCVLWGGVFFAVMVFLLVMFYTYPGELNGTMLFYETTRNYISVYMIVFLLIYAVSLCKNHLLMTPIPIMITLVCSLIGVGRGGIIASFVIFLIYGIYFVFIRRYKNQKRKKIVVIIAAALILIFIVAVIFTYKEILRIFLPRFNYLYFSTGEHASGDPRLSIWSAYLTDIIQSPQSILLGKLPMSIPAVFELSVNNLHCSFLQSHAYLGIGGVLTGAVLLINSFVYMIKNKYIELIAIFIGFLVRAVFDYCFPGFLCDVVLWFFMLMPFAKEVWNRQTNRSKRTQKVHKK